MTFWYELLLLCFPLVILLSYVSQVKLIFIFETIRWLKTHVILQEAVLQFAGRIIWNDEEKFLSPTTPTCHEIITDTPLALLTLLWISSVPPPCLETVAPKYTNLSTSSISRPFTSTTSLFLEFICRSLHLSTLTFSPTLSTSCANLSVLI